MALSFILPFPILMIVSMAPSSCILDIGRAQKSTSLSHFRTPCLAFLFVFVLQKSFTPSFHAMMARLLNYTRQNRPSLHPNCFLWFKPSIASLLLHWPKLLAAPKRYSIKRLPHSSKMIRRPSRSESRKHSKSLPKRPCLRPIASLTPQNGLQNMMISSNVCNLKSSLQETLK